jgi:DNA-binding HxlR family transcriptional regulator
MDKEEEKTKYQLLQERLNQTEEMLVPILKALAHNHRFKIIKFLLDGPKTFAMITKYIDIKRTAASNHVNTLLDVKLINRIEKGHYQITIQGIEFLQLIFAFHDTNITREHNFILDEPQIKSKSSSQINKLTTFTISHPAKYESCWISFLGCLFGVLKSLKVKTSMSEVAGYTGYAFYVNISTAKLSPSGPTTFSNYIWDSIKEGIHYHGWEFKEYTDMGRYPKSVLKNENDQLKALKLYNWIQDNLKVTNHPIILWGAFLPEFGIVNGVNNETYQVSTYRYQFNSKDSPINFDSLECPSYLQALSFIKKESTSSQEQMDLNALKKALTFNLKAPPTENYTIGPSAYQIWSKNLKNKFNQPTAYHANSYLGECYYELKTLCVLFLNTLADRYSGNRSKKLKQAAQEYQEVMDLLAKFKKIFPFAMKGKFTQNMIQKGFGILQAIPPYEENAFKIIQEIVENW